MVNCVVDTGEAIMIQPASHFIHKISDLLLVLLGPVQRDPLLFLFKIFKCVYNADRGFFNVLVFYCQVKESSIGLLQHSRSTDYFL